MLDSGMNALPKKIFHGEIVKIKSAIIAPFFDKKINESFRKTKDDNK